MRRLRPAWLDRRSLVIGIVVLVGCLPLGITAAHNSEWYTVVACTTMVLATWACIGLTARARYVMEGIKLDYEQARAQYEAASAEVERMQLELIRQGEEMAEDAALLGFIGTQPR